MCRKNEEAMKVERKKPEVKFEPITITLETREEALYLWLIMWRPHGSSQLLPIVDEKREQEFRMAMDNQTVPVWHKFSNVFSP